MDDYQLSPIHYLPTTFRFNTPSRTRTPRLNGDTRRRKKRLRLKLAKQDAARSAIQYKQATDAWLEIQKLQIEQRFMDDLMLSTSTHPRATGKSRTTTALAILQLEREIQP